MKGSQIGTESLYAQQTTIYERHSLRSNTPPSSSFCPRSHSMKNLNKIIEHLSERKTCCRTHVRCKPIPTGLLQQ